MKKFSIAVLVILLVLVMSLPRSLESYAQTIVNACKTRAYRPACYEKEIPKLMEKISMEDAFAVTKFVQEKDPQFAYCHVVAHILTERETKKNASQWKNVMLRCPMATCNYGCLHGSLIARFRGESLSDEQIEEMIPDISDVCEPRIGFNPTPIEKTMCYHGIGHLAMYMTDGKPEKSIPICERVGKEYVKTCVEGIFMTVFQSIDPEDLALVIDIKPKKEGVADFCKAFGSYWQHCRRESFFLFLQEAENPQKLNSLCSYAIDQESRRDCYWAYVNVITDKAFERGQGITSINSYCKNVPWCYSGAAMRLVQVDPANNIRLANEICQMAQNDTSDCYNNLLYYATFSFSAQSELFVSYCQALSDPWRNQCLSQK